MVEVDHRNLLFMATAALTMLCQTLLEASLLFTSTAQPVGKNAFRQNSLSRKAYMFIQGTGLDIVIEAYGIDYNPKELRDSFNKIFKATT